MANPRELFSPVGRIVQVGRDRLKVLEWCEDGSLIALEADGETVFLPASQIRDAVIRKGEMIEQAYHLAVAAYEDMREARLDALRRETDRGRERLAAMTAGQTPALGPEEIEGFLERFAGERA